MIGGFYLANMYWRWEAGVTFVSCIGCIIVQEKPGQDTYYRSPDYDFVVENSAKSQVPKAFEVLLTKEINRRWPELFESKK